jgi:hypothetical protein
MTTSTLCPTTRVLRIVGRSVNERVGITPLSAQAGWAPAV